LDNVNPNPKTTSPFASNFFTDDVPEDSTASLLDFGRAAADDSNSLVSWQREAFAGDPFSALARDVNPPAAGAPDWTDGTVNWQSDPFLAGLPPTPERVAVGPTENLAARPHARPVMPPVQHAPMVQMMYQAQPAHQVVPGFFPQAPAPAQPSEGGPQHVKQLQHAAGPQQVMQPQMRVEPVGPRPVVRPQVVPRPTMPQAMNVSQMMMSPQTTAHAAMPQTAMPYMAMPYTAMPYTATPQAMGATTSLLLQGSQVASMLPTPFALARGIDAPTIVPQARALPFVTSRSRRAEIDPLVIAYHKGKKRQRRNAAVGRLLMYLTVIALAAGSYAGYLWYKR
jgi:hypothetical protein